MPRTINMNKINHLGKLRMAAGLNRQEVADTLRVSTEYIRQLETKGCSKMLDVEKAKLLCPLYNCDLDAIYNNKIKKSRK
jgi:transcriptional regulator with XRE-family HTH domain